MAIPLVDGAPLRICAPYCLTRWSKDGKFLFVFLWRSRREPARGEAWQFPRSGGKPAGSSRGRYRAAGRPERGSWSRIGWARSTGVGQGPRAKQRLAEGVQTRLFDGARNLRAEDG